MCLWVNTRILYTWKIYFLPPCMNCRRGLAMRILSVCPSVRPSVTHVDCDKTVERSVQIYIPYERTFSLVFWEEEWLVGATPSTWNFESEWMGWCKIWTISCDNSKTVRDRMSVTINHTNSKSHMGFRLVPTSMTLNDPERHNSPYFAFFSRNSTDFRPIISQWLKIDL